MTSAERPLTELLLNPDAYRSLAPTTRVQLIETHISWVFVLDHEVFKLKRPVELGFLDFRSVEQRRRACEAEVQLNSRLAPGVYLGVVPLRKTEPGPLQFGGSGEIVDWAVRMRRLADAARGDQLLVRGELDAQAVELLAQTLAHFHAQCRSDAETARFGSREALSRNVEENIAQTAGTIDAYLSADEARELCGWQREFLANHEALLAERAVNGRVRDGHGDLRLEQLYIEQGRVVILDCIEFNERFRFADVCADVGFLAMDLLKHDRVELGELLLASYARDAQDYQLYSVADFYLGYRAFVRGKVAAMLAADCTVAEATRERARRDARAYFLLALSAHRPRARKPQLLAVAGVIGSGKSTVAGRAGAFLSAPIIDADRTRKHLFQVEPTARLGNIAWQGAYGEHATARVYDELLRRAQIVLESGRPVILDASFRTRGLRAAARELTERLGVPFRLLECRAPAEICKARLTARDDRTISDGRVELFDDFSAHYEAIVELPPNQHTVIDTHGTEAETQRQLEHALR